MQNSHHFCCMPHNSPQVKNVEHVFTGGLAAAGRAFVDMMVRA
jgi:hypothetical protein